MFQDKLIAKKNAEIQSLKSTINEKVLNTCFIFSDYMIAVFETRAIEFVTAEVKLISRFDQTEAGRTWSVSHWLLPALDGDTGRR